MKKYRFKFDEMIRDLKDELRSIDLTTNQNHSEFFLCIEQLRSDLAAHKQPVNGRSYEYKQDIERVSRRFVHHSQRSDFSVNDIHRTISVNHGKYVNRKGKPKIGGRSSVHNGQKNIVLRLHCQPIYEGRASDQNGKVAIATELCPRRSALPLSLQFLPGARPVKKAKQNWPSSPFWARPAGKMVQNAVKVHRKVEILANRGASRMR